jgi:hypothetical protein
MSQNEATFAELLRLKQRLEEKYEFLTKQCEEVEKQLLSVTTTLDLLGYRGEDKPREELIFPPEQVKGLTHHQALERIAKANQGRFKMTEAIRVLVAARLISNPKNAYSILFNTIKRVGKFKRVGPGEYGFQGALLAEAATK